MQNLLRGSAPWQRLNKSWRNDRRPGGISNAILQFAQYLICRNSYNSLLANILLTEIIGPRGERRVGGLRAGKMLRCTGDVRGFAVLQITISLKYDGKSRNDAKRDECSFHLPARTRGVNRLRDYMHYVTKIKNTVCNKISEIILRQWTSLVLIVCAMREICMVCNWRRIYIWLILNESCIFQNSAC